MHGSFLVLTERRHRALEGMDHVGTKCESRDIPAAICSGIGWYVVLSLLCMIGVYLVVPVSGAISASEGIRSGTTADFAQTDDSLEVMEISLVIYTSVLATNVMTTLLIGIKSWSVQIELRSIIS